MAKKFRAELSQSVAPKSVHKDGEDPMKDYETQGHLDTIIKAHQIINDPEKMQKVHALAGRHHQAIKSIQDLKNTYNQRMIQKGQKGGTKVASMSSLKNDDDGDET